MKIDFNKLTIFIFISLTISQASTDWSYDSDRKILYSISSGGDIECAAPDNKTVYRGRATVI